MGRGVSAGGGQSSLGYLFGGVETLVNKAKAQNQAEAQTQVAAPAQNPVEASPPPQKTAVAPKPSIDKQIPAGIHGSLTIRENDHLIKIWEKGIIVLGIFKRT
ncbi:hypothetical protein L484_005551 [Morus notabilis]|uniref:Protein SPIRAL1-like 1 n=1 Tax=Morus notabilis TaxID=981085 RepID=W9RCF0_9ROSA|nr:hypothetical protein L484_005551 [Morus notabilis]